jgi:hypothetical protein
MKPFTAIFLAAVLLAGCHARVEAPSGPFDFRQTRWGMSQKEVMSSEKEQPIYQSLNRLLYATEVIDKRFMLEYHLGDDRLYRARYILVANHVVDDKYVADYRDIQSVLTAKYGRPKKNETVWRTGVGVRKDLPPGVSVSIGHMSMVSAWETPDTEIVATLAGRNFEIQCEVTYTSKVLRPLVEKYDDTDPGLGGQGGKVGSDFGSKQLEDAVRDF